MTGYLYRDIKHSLRRFWEKKYIFLFSYILVPIVLGIFRSQSASVSDGLRLTALMTAILVAFSNCDFKEEKKQNFVEPLLSTPYPVFLIVCCRFLVAIFYWIVFSAMNMGLVYLLNVNLFGNEGFYVIMDIAYYLVIIFLGIVMSLSVWNTNLLPKMTSSFVSLGVLILGITSAFNNISMTLIIGVIMLLLAFGGIITFLFTYNKENLIGD
ncbi:MAG: hypothetical protein PHG06_22725 [Parabacteroides sp.]|jgi:hypothetical protein|nr:hypothetical protein [Parabacteroides sp.]